MTNANITRPKFIKKKFILLSKTSHNPAKTPDNLLPMLVAKNHPPINNAVSLGGLNLDTNESPIGDRHNSPIVITPYVLISHHALDLLIVVSVK